MKYDVQIADVREVSLWGTADLPHWTEVLRPARLHPTVLDGRALLLILACAARFKGIPFRELSISVSVSRQEGGIGRDGAYLLQAWNSIRVFAFVERVVFKTPYDYGGVQVEPGPPAYARLTTGAATITAAMAGPGREPTRTGDENWEGPVFLPDRRAAAHGSRLFYAKLAGPTRTYRFEPERDVVTFDASRGAAVLRHLAESHFTGREWMVRDAATHGKSKTVARGETW